MISQMAGLLGRILAIRVNPTVTLPRYLIDSQRSLHRLSHGKRGDSLLQSCLCCVPKNTSIARTQIRHPQDNLRPLSNLAQGPFCRLYHTSKNNQRRNNWSFSYANLMRRTWYGSSCTFASPGLVRACNGSLLGCRWISSGQRKAWKHRNRSVMMYGVAVVILIIGFSYAAVPLYAVFCQATGLGGQATKGHNIDLVEDMVPVRGRTIAIRFNADTAASMRWNFRPQQLEIKVVPGETALAFYSAVNPTDKPITGISTYNVVPFEAGQYFNKIQCFCFEEQRLNPHEQVDMPVFFYIDPEFAEDPKMAKVDDITLSYTFFEAKEGLVLPDPFTRPAEVKA